MQESTGPDRGNHCLRQALSLASCSVSLSLWDIVCMGGVNFVSLQNMRLCALITTCLRSPTWLDGNLWTQTTLSAQRWTSQLLPTAAPVGSSSPVSHHRHHHRSPLQLCWFWPAPTCWVTTVSTRLRPPLHQPGLPLQWRLGGLTVMLPGLLCALSRVLLWLEQPYLVHCCWLKLVTQLTEPPLILGIPWCCVVSNKTWWHTRSFVPRAFSEVMAESLKSL